MATLRQNSVSHERQVSLKQQSQNAMVSNELILSVSKNAFNYRRPMGTIQSVTTPLQRHIGNQALAHFHARQALYNAPQRKIHFHKAKHVSTYEGGISIQCKDEQDDREFLSPSNSGLSLPDTTRLDMEEELKANFSDVRIHTNAEAGKNALEMGAKAFTYKQNVYFAPGYYQPKSSAGQALIAHELTHVTQQRNGLSSTLNAPNQNLFEIEAGKAERTFQAKGLVQRVYSMPQRALIQRSLVDDAKSKRFESIQQLGDYLLSRLGNNLPPKINELQQIQKKLQGRSSITVSQNELNELKSIYALARQLAPSWVPVPNLNFEGQPVQRAIMVAGVAIPLSVVILLALAVLLIVLYAIVGQRAIAHSVERFLNTVREIISNALPRPAPPIPEEEPLPEWEPERSGVRPRPTPPSRPASPAQPEEPLPDWEPEKSGVRQIPRGGSRGSQPDPGTGTMEETGPTIGPNPTQNDEEPDKLEILKRRGIDWESPTRLGRKSADAEAKIKVHGVSVTAGIETIEHVKAPRFLVAQHFRVHNTKSGRDPFHRTIELPKPVTKEVAIRFNTIFGRSYRKT